MKKFLLLGCLFTAALSLNAASAKSYQVTGPVLEVTDSYVVVQKGDEKWQIAADQKVQGSAKVGDKVTVYYQMVAQEIEVKPAK